MPYIFCAIWQTSLRFRFFVHSGGVFCFFVCIPCVNSDCFLNPCGSSFLSAWSDLKPICVFVLPCGKRFIPIPYSLFRFSFQLRFPFPFHFPIPVPFPIPWPVPCPLRFRLRRSTLSRRAASLSFAAAMTILPTFRRSRIVHTAPAPIPPSRANATQNGITQNQILFLRITQKKREKRRNIAKMQENTEICAGSICPRKNLKNVKVAARKISRGV